MNTKDIRLKLEGIIDPSVNKTLKETDGIKHIGIDSDKDIAILIITMEKKDSESEKTLKREIAKAIKLDLGFKGVKIQLEERRINESIVKTNAKFLIITSGKGGVGKSTVAANLAYYLKKNGKTVALLDADIYGSSLPRVLDMEEGYPQVNEKGKLIPRKVKDMEIMSTEFFVEGNKPVIWRGAMLHSMMNNFFYETSWDKNLDYMVIDAPPGTGDVALDLRQIVPNAKSIVVTTPHKTASHVAIKAGYASVKLKQEVLGVVENMAYYYNEYSKEKDYIFGEGGGKEVAENLNVELLAQIPINRPKHNVGLYEEDEKAGQIFNDLAKKIIEIY